MNTTKLIEDLLRHLDRAKALIPQDLPWHGNTQPTMDQARIYLQQGMDDRLTYYQEKYGPDFLKKIGYYVTAYWKDECVALLGVDRKRLVFTVRTIAGEIHTVALSELDDFVL